MRACVRVCLPMCSHPLVWRWLIFVVLSYASFSNNQTSKQTKPRLTLPLAWTGDDCARLFVLSFLVVSESLVTSSLLQRPLRFRGVGLLHSNPSDPPEHHLLRRVSRSAHSHLLCVEGVRSAIRFPVTNAQRARGHCARSSVCGAEGKCRVVVVVVVMGVEAEDGCRLSKNGWKNASDVRGR